jgi:hypothetical protein
MEQAKIVMRHDNFMKDEAELPIQFVSASNTVAANGLEYSLDALKPFSVRAPSFNATVDGKDTTTLGDSKLWTGTDNGASILLVKDEQDEASFIHIMDGKDETMLVSMPMPGTKMTGRMVSMAQDDYDYKTMNAMFRYDDIIDESPTTTTTSSATESSAASSGACSSFRTIEVAIAFDSTFCASFGGTASGAQNRVEAIVGMASQRYEVSGLCTNIKISAIEGFCNPSTDIYKNVIGNDNLLAIFRNYWNRYRQNIPRDTAHLFSGTDYSTSNAIGVAYLDAVCGSKGYGVNWITFTNSLLSQALLFTHELGHNAGADHFRTTDTGHIMNPSTFDRKEECTRCLIFVDTHASIFCIMMFCRPQLWAEWLLQSVDQQHQQLPE